MTEPEEETPIAVDAVQRERKAVLAEMQLTAKQIATDFVTLEEVRFDNINLDDAMIHPLFEGMNYNSHVHTISLINNDITDRGLKMLAKCCQRKKGLGRLLLGSNHISDKGIKHVVRLLESSDDLMELNLVGKKPKR
jgi:Ran GTPase-activating protein (RanGAP) involved in mRNA processing and transport